MSIIFKVLKYLKEHITLILIFIATLAVVFSIAFGISASHWCNLYEEEAEITSKMKEDIKALTDERDTLNTTKEQLSEKVDVLTGTVETQTTQLTTYEETIKELQGQVDALTEEVNKLKATSKKTTTNSTPTSSSTNTTKSESNKTTYPSPTPSTTTNTTTSGTTEEDKPTSPTYVEGQYPEATQVWNYLKGMGLNNYVCAGIMGNIMAEVGGQTLNIGLYAFKDTGTYYGICQWAGSRKSRLLNNYGRDLQAQLNFLGVELYEEIPASSSFYSMQDEKQAALYFAQYYERCGSSSYGVRQSNATKALAYFVGA